MVVAERSPSEEGASRRAYVTAGWLRSRPSASAKSGTASTRDPRVTYILGHDGTDGADLPGSSPSANRRVLLDHLFPERDGQTLGELCGHLPAMTRFGVMRHLGVLEEACLVSTVRVGREKRHFSIRSRSGWSTTAGSASTPRRSLARCRPSRRTWRRKRWSRRITSTPSTSRPSRIGSGGPSPMASRPSSTTTAPVSAPTGRRARPLPIPPPDGSIAADGSVIEIELGRRVVMTFHPRWHPEIEAEGPVRMTWWRGDRRRWLAAHRHQRAQLRLQERRGVCRRYRLKTSSRASRPSSRPGRRSPSVEVKGGEGRLGDRLRSV